MRKSRTIEIIESVIITKKRLFFEKLPKIFKLLVLILAIAILVTDNNSKKVVFKRVSCFYYSIKF